jgi:membrane-associated phospholipid phosphatase
MLQWLLNLDERAFRLLNEGIVNPFFDKIMPFASGNAFFYPVLVIVCIWLVFKGGTRGRLCVLMLVLAVAVSDGWICKTLKHAINRDRPFVHLENVRLLLGRGNSPGMPSSHAANWFAATIAVFVYYRRSLAILLPLALLVSLSRIYNGVHYPSDVIVGALLGGGSAVAVMVALNAAWRLVGHRWFPLWWKACPSLTQIRRSEMAEDEEIAVPHSRQTRASEQARHVDPDAHWLRLGYVLIAALFVARLAYIASGTIELSEDEAYQWLWSKHLALSYYSKPLLIAVTQFLGTSIWGDNAFGVRFFSPVIGFVLSIAMLRFFARTVNARASFFLLLIITATPLMALGSVLMTVDPLSVLFWTAAMILGWKAAQPAGKTADWFWTGLLMGLGFLSKPTELFQLLSWVMFFILWPQSRKHLRRVGPYLALIVHALCTLPVVIWNSQRHWITTQDISHNAALGQGIHIRVLDFLGVEAGLLNPFFFIATIWACIVFWKKSRHSPVLIYLFSMGAPVFLFYLAWSFHSRILPNWIAPSVLPLFCLMVAYWDTRWRLDSSRLKPWLVAGLSLGAVMVILGYNTDLVAKLTGHYLPVNLDPLHRVRCWSGVARETGKARDELLAEGKPVFIITDHYGMAGEISFYLPEAKAAAKETPIVYYKSSPYPRNQFYFWPGYSDRKGQNALYVVELDRDTLTPARIPQSILDEFESVTNMGVHNVLYHGRINRPLQFFACHNLK